ncbi:MAG: hypothetical protein ACLQJ7_17240 [Syntrophobacteraceae bacterium]
MVGDKRCRHHFGIIRRLTSALHLSKVFGSDPRGQVYKAPVGQYVKDRSQPTNRCISIYGYMLDRLVREAGGEIFSSSKVAEVNDHGVVIEKAGGKRTIKWDKVLPAWNRKSRIKLHESLKGRAP